MHLHDRAGTLASLLYKRETLNLTDKYAIAVLKDDVIIGYLLRLSSPIGIMFIARGGAVTCVVAT